MWKEGKVASSHYQVEVIAPQSPVKLEAVSPRLKKELIHPNRGSVLIGLRYSSDGKLIIAGDYPGGIIQVWDSETGRQLTKLETGYGYRPGSDYFCLTPDWKAVFVPREKRKASHIEKDGKKLIRWEYDGDVRSWDVETGQLRDTYRHSPARGMGPIVLSPDGRTFLCFEKLANESEGPQMDATSLWDVKTTKSRPLPENLEYWSVYSPDGNTFASPAKDEKGRTTLIKLFDVKSAKEKAAFAVAEEKANLGFIALSPDGKLLVGQVRSPKGNWLRLWDIDSGQEVASFKAENNDLFLRMAFSPDNRTLVATITRGERGKLFLFDLPERKLRKTVIFAEKAMVHQPVFSPDGKWIAVASQVFPDDRLKRDASPEDLPQPLIHLIDVATGEIHETLISPQCFPTSACFSHDGKTLATAGYGRVLLWDLRIPPGSAGSGSESKK
jgi:WD40 repeat protein